MSEPTIKALPLWQPWATLVAIGAKRIETRSFPAHRLGLKIGQRIAIHATKTPRELWICEEEPFCEYVKAADLPLGAIVATATLEGWTEIVEEKAAKLADGWPHEYAFGDYSPGRWAWRLGDVRQLPSPVPFTGSQGTFDVPLSLLGEAVQAPAQGSLL